MRRRDWLQAAAAGRWRSLTDGVLDTLVLAKELEFVHLMAGTDPRVALQLQTARMLHHGALA